MSLINALCDELSKSEPAARERRARSGVADLLADTRGGIFLLGIGLGMVLVGVAWNVSSLGAAAVWRERATDVADAAAFDSAVWHARGMNLLVMSNLLMAIFMALFTFWRMIVTVLAGLSYLCNWPLFPPCAFVQTLAGQAARIDDRVAQNVSALLRSLTSTQRALASLTPVVPMALTPETLLKRFPQAQAVQTFSQALLPSKSSQGKGFGNLATDWQNLVDGKVLRSLEQRLGVGVSMPVQADDFDVLCSRSVEAQQWLTRRMLPFDIQRFGPWWQAMTGGNSGFFCLNDAFPPELRQAVRTGLIVTCAVADEPWTCVRRRLARFRPTPLAGSSGSGAVSTNAMWDQFENGSPFASVFAVSGSKRPLLDLNDQMIAIPDLPGLGSLPPLSSTGHVASQGEYYCDCEGKWPECRDYASWGLCWRARLRPLRTAANDQDWLAVVREVMRHYGGPAWELATKLEAPGNRTPTVGQSRLQLDRAWQR